LAVRPEFLRLLENHILSLNAQSLRAPLKAIILCILPGLEDESSEDHDAWLQLMNKIRVASRDGLTNEASEDGTSRDSYFWQSFFLATTTNPSRRQGALSYLVREMPTFATSPSTNSEEANTEYPSVAAKAALSPEPGLLIRCLAAGLSDGQVLVQRGFLDLLVTHLPLDSPVVQKYVPQADLDRLVFAATGVVGRRDMSLNRRLWAWFLGPEAKEEPETPATPNVKSPDPESSRQAAYFSRYGLNALSRSMRSQFASKSLSSIERARPYKLCLSLMDRWEVGGLLIPEILIPAMQSALDFSNTAEKSAASEVIKSASNFFDGVESSLIWATFNKLIEETYAPRTEFESSRVKKIALCTFIVLQFNIREEEMVLQHIPQSALFMLAQMKKLYQTATIYEQYGSLMTDSLAILEKLLTLVPTRAYAGAQKTSDITKRKEVGANLSIEDIIRRIKRFYGEQHGGVDGTPVPFPPIEVGLLIIRQATTLLLDLYSTAPQSASLDILSRIVCGLILTVPRASLSLLQLNLIGSFTSTLSSVEGEMVERIPFRILSSMTALLFTLQTSPNPLPSEKRETESLEILLIGHLWSYLNPHNPKHHVESVRCIWQLESIDPSRKLIEAVVTTLLSKDISLRSERNSSAPATAARQFAVLWNHSMQERTPSSEKSNKGLLRKPSNSFPALGQFSVPTDPSNILTRPLLLLLDCLQDEGTELSLFLRYWLQELPSLSRVFLIITDRLRSLQCMKESKSGGSAALLQYDDTQECLYYLRILLEMVRNSSEQVWLTLAGDLAEPLSRGTTLDSQTTIQILIVQLALRATNIPTKASEFDLSDANDVHRTALELITELLHGAYPRAIADFKIYEPLLYKLHENIGSMDSLQQAVLLRATAAALKLSFSHPEESTVAASHARKSSKDILSTGSMTSLVRNTAKESSQLKQHQSPALLIECLKLGFETGSSHLAIDNWVEFLIEVVPLFPESIFQEIIPLVECLCKQIALVFTRMKTMYRSKPTTDHNVPEPTLIGLLNALEHIIANAHRRLLREDGQIQNPKTPDQPQGFFGNMVQGVFTADSEKSFRSTVANDRLTVLLCFQDALRTCFSIWSWGSASQEKPDSSSLASYNYTAMRMRNRARRLLEHLFAAEALECMETLASLWCKPARAEFEPSSVFGLLNVLSGSKPKHTIPAIFNAIYSRTNPAALEPSKISSLTSELQDLDLVAFLVEYTRTLDDDAMDEIWSDCAAFLRDVLANPLPHSQILPFLLLFTALLAEKVDNTNFGEQQKLRRDLGVRIMISHFRCPKY
jgi:hypothetical protein